mgnify:CR=1 FL=1
MKQLEERVKRNNIVLDGRRLNNKGDRGGGGSPRKVLDAEIIAESKNHDTS